jgi:hypothetical protein
MRSIDAVGPPQHRLVLESFGVTLEVASDDRELFDSLPPVLPPGWRRASREPAARFALTGDGAITLDGAPAAPARGDRDAALLRLGAIVRHHVALHAPNHVFIHAGVVSAGDTSIVIPGSSRSGKTTLVAELVRAGAMYHSDEYAPVDPEGMIEPYAKPLSIRSAGGDGPGALHPVPDGQVATRPIRAGLVVVTGYEAGAAWRPTACTGGEGALALLRHTVAARTRPSHALAVVSRLAREGRVIAGVRGEASEMADALLDAAGVREKDSARGI